MDPKDFMELRSEWDNGCIETRKVMLDCLNPGKMTNELLFQNSGVKDEPKVTQEEIYCTEERILEGKWIFTHSTVSSL